MNRNIFGLRMLFVFITIFFLFNLQAQSDIKINNFKVNHIDKKKRKQGDWIFFDKAGNVRLSCVFKDDNCISPIVFYENSDTSFVRLPASDSVEHFILFKNKKNYFGNFIHTSDSTSIIEIEPDSTITDDIIFEIKKYQNISMEPTYFFAQKKLTDYLGASFSSSNIIFNKEFHVLLTISSSGFVTKVEFPIDRVHLSTNEENELRWIYSTMPRWQPFFYKNKTQSVKIMISNNSTLSIISFDH